MYGNGCKCGVNKRHIVGATVNSDIKIGHEFDVVLTYEDVPDYVPDSSLKGCAPGIITPCKCNEEL